MSVHQDEAATHDVALPEFAKERAPRWLAPLGFLLVLVVVAAVTVRDAGTYAHTFADERSYSYYSRVMPLSEAPVPSYLYLKLYSATAMCGDGALSCARFMNALFFAAALPLLYLVARRFASWRTAALLVAVTAASPFNTYTAFYTPESMYFFGVWLLMWIVTDARQRWRALTAGVVVGLLSVVKLHGIFLVPSIAVVIGASGWWAGRARGALTAMIAFGLTTLMVRFGVGWLLAGSPGLSLLGPMYGAQAHVGRPLGEILSAAVGIGWRHVQALVVLFALPVASVVIGLRADSPSSGPGLRLPWLLLVLLVPLLVITAVFSAKVAGEGPYESAARLHMRYYNFLVPLLMLVGLAQLEQVARRGLGGVDWWRVASAAAVVGVGAFALLVGLDGLHALSPDCPDIVLLRTGHGTFLVTSVVGLAALAFWALRPREGRWVHLLVALPMLTFAATGAATREVTATRTPSIYDTGGEVARRLLGAEGVEHVHVVSPDLANAFRVLFTLNNRDGTFDFLPNGSVVRRPSPQKDWLLVFGEYVVEGEHRFVLRTPGFSLIHFE